MCDNGENRWESVSDYGTKMDMFVSYSDSEFDENDEEYDDFDETSSQIYFEMAGSLVEVLGSTPRMGRRSMALADIDPKYVSQSGIWEASDVETSRGSIRIQHLTAVTSAGQRPLSCANSIGSGPSGIGSRFPKLEECAHFHYDILELPLLKIRIRDEPNKYNSISGEETSGDNFSSSISNFSIEVLSGGQSWFIRRTYANFKKLDEQLHRCVWDRSFSQLQKVIDYNNFLSEGEHEKSASSEEEQNGYKRRLVEQYLERLSQLPTNQITCGTVLSWLEIDNRGRHIVSSDDSAINTPAVAAACAIRQYVAQASDELSFEVGDMISVIDMPPPEESSWWRGKRRFTVGFFPRECVQVIGEKVPPGLTSVPTSRKQQRLSSVSSSSASTNGSSTPEKPVLRKHGKLIAFFRSFILSRPSRRRLKQTGILRERVFGCDLAEHLLNTGTEIPVVLKCCAEFIELQGIVDGIYRVSGITSNIQKLRNAFDEDRVPNLQEDEAIKQDIHAVASLLKMYFRELPNPITTYQLYNKFREAIESCDEDRLQRMREVAQELPPFHQRTLEYLLKHLARVAEQSSQTGMTIRNMAIVWAPNLIRCKDLEAGGVTALKGIGVQAIVTEYLVRHADLIFNNKFAEELTSPNSGLKSLPLSPPIKFLSLDGEHDDIDDDRKYIEVGGGPSSLPKQYHTVIDIAGRRSSLKSKRSAMGWRTFFSRNRSFSKPHRKVPEICLVGPPTNVQHLQTSWPGRLPLRPVKSVESLVSTPLYHNSSSNVANITALNDTVLEIDETGLEEESCLSKSNLPSVVNNTDDDCNHITDASGDSQKQQNPKTHNRSISHDSYFEFGEFLKKNDLYIDETLEEEDDTESKLSLELSNDIASNSTSPTKESSSGIMGDTESVSSRLKQRSSFGNSSLTLPTVSASSLIQQMSESCTSAVSSSSDDPTSTEVDEAVLAKSPLLKPKPRYSILRNVKNSETDTLQSKLLDTDTTSSQYSEGEKSGSEVHRSYEQALNTSHIFKDFSLPLDRDITSISTFGNGVYEIDRNSSFDNSSADTTPGGESYGTNIVYSPLVNENAPSPGYDNYNVKSDISLPATSLFVCPLYESGHNIANKAEVTSLKKNRQHEGSSLEPKKSFKTQIRQYENIEILVPSTEDDSFISNEEAPGILWDQGRIYQNISHQVVAEPFDELYLQQEVRVIHVDGNSVQPPLLENGGNEHFDQHYENVSTRDIASPENEEGLYETNIYEDIDDDEDETTVSNHKPESARPPSLPSRNNRSPDPRASCMSNSSDASAGEAYESVQFCRSELQLIDLSKQHENDCYAEVGLQNSVPDLFPKVTSNAMDSPKIEKSLSGSPQSEDHSLCQTDDVITYLEVHTSHNNTQPNTDSLEELDSEARNGCTLAATPSTEDEEEIRHIDSPLVVDNPLYGLEFKEKSSKHIKRPVEPADNKDKLIGRSNSVPLTENLNNIVRIENGNNNGGHSLPSDIPEQIFMNESKRNFSDSTDLNIIDNEMLLLWKRLSEPSLSVSKRDEKNAAAFEAWKLADAKRLAHRKQSVKELLSKFETKESISPSPSPTNSCNWKNARNSPGLPPVPRSDSKQNKNLRQQNATKFQHHRFSIGDILMSQSLTSADMPTSQPTGYALMSRSDTFPELRTDSSKENESTTEPEGHCNSSPSSVLVPEKVQSAIRVAMSSVDMNDPNTRERIEKYKEERRLFLRQKLSSDRTEVKSSGICSNELINSSTTQTTTTIPSITSFDRSSSTCSSNNDSVFTSSNIRIINVTDDVKTSIESPRKRAFSEDVAQQNSYANQNKAIKTEPFKTLPAKDSTISPPSSTSTFTTENVELVTEEINVREKVALWSTATNNEKKLCSSPYGDSLQRSSKSKPYLVEACSLPIEGTILTRKPSPPVIGLRRELTTGSIDMNRAKLSSRTPGGLPGDSSKKIKDMAAFFEGKHF